MAFVRVTVTASALPAKLVLNRGRGLNVDQFWRFCGQNPDLRLELTARREIVVRPWAGLDGSFRIGEASFQLHRWAERNGRGRGLGSDAGYALPNGAVLSPNASWVSNERVAPLTKEQRRRWLPFAPDFIIELVSPFDQIGALRTKMDEWIANGALLGWLIDPDNQTVYVYKPDHPVKEKHGLSRISGEGPVAGFVLQLKEIWAGLAAQLT